MYVFRRIKSLKITKSVVFAAFILAYTGTEAAILHHSWYEEDVRSSGTPENDD